MKLGNYVVIQSWMVSELHLKGNELLIYAIIYGFSQDDQQFTGTLKYLQDWTGATKPTVLAALKSLTDKGLLRKYDRLENGVKLCSYQAADPEQLGGKETLPPPVKNFYQGGQETLPDAVKNLNQGGKNSLPVLLNTNYNTLSKRESAREEKNQKHRYGEYQNVLLTDDELDKLKQAYPSDWQQRIDRLSEYMATSGKTYKSHLATIRMWARRDAEREEHRPEVDRRGFYQAPVAPGERPKDDMELIRRFLQQQEEAGK